MRELINLICQGVLFGTFFTMNVVTAFRFTKERNSKSFSNLLLTLIIFLIYFDWWKIMLK